MNRTLRTLLFVLLPFVAVALLGLVLKSGMRLGEPTRLVALAIPAALVAAEVVHSAWRRAFLARFGPAASTSGLVRGLPVRQQLAATVLLVAATTLLVVAAARPQWGEKAREVERRGIDVVFAVDLSRSMLATDIAPSRLEATAAELDRLMRRLNGDRVGLVVFAADAVKQSPLTSDYGAIRHYLRRVHPDHFSRQGTAIGRAILAGLELLTGDGNEEFRRASNQLIIVLSDGEDTISDPIAAASQALEAGVRVYTVGIGTLEGGPIPVRDADDSVRGYLTDRMGQTVITRLEESQLIEIAAAGGGSFRRYSNEGSVSTFIESAINNYESEALSSALRAEYVDRFALFLYPGLLLLIFATLLRTALPRQALARLQRALPAAALLLPLAGCDQLPEREDASVRAAVEALGEGDLARARERLESASALARASAEWAYDLGLVDAEARLWESAQVRFLDAISSRLPVTRARALFALGNTLLERERWDEAIVRYRRVLEIDPDHAGARRNLEIALRRKFPPCSTLEDTIEPNDDAASAPDLPASFYRGDFIPQTAPREDGAEASSQRLVLCGDNADWFALPLMGGSKITVEVSLRRLREDRGTTPPPDRIEPTDVRIALLEYDGVSALAVDQGLDRVDEDGLIPAARVERRLIEVDVPSTFGMDATGFLKIDAAPDLEYSYSLRVTILPPCHALEDEFEPNDLPSTASALTERDHVIEARLCPGNDDWYRITLPAGETLFVDLEGFVRESGEPGTPQWTLHVDDPSTPALTHVPDDEERFHTWAIDAADVDRTIWLHIASADEEDAGHYRASIHRYPPCPEGNDRYEPNDLPSARHRLTDEGPGPWRHLRLCEGDVDWYEVAIPEPPEEEDEDDAAAAKSRIFTAVLAMRGARERALLRVIDPESGRVIATSTADDPALVWAADAPHPDIDPNTPDAVRPPADPLALGDYGPVTVHVAAFEVPETMTSVVVVLEGDAAWYHLAFPEIEAQQQQQQQQDQQQQNEDGDDEGDPEDRESGDDEDGEERDDESPAPSESSEPEPPTEPQDAPEPGEESEEERRERMLRLLESLEREDRNLQIEQTLREAIPERIERPW